MGMMNSASKKGLQGCDIGKQLTGLTSLKVTTVTRKAELQTQFGQGVCLVQGSVEKQDNVLAGAASIRPGRRHPELLEVVALCQTVYSAIDAVMMVPHKSSQDGQTKGCGVLLCSKSYGAESCRHEERRRAKLAKLEGNAMSGFQVALQPLQAFMFASAPHLKIELIRCQATARPLWILLCVCKPEIAHKLDDEDEHDMRSLFSQPGRSFEVA
eukprot:786480-Amphidinium_carterae.1